jgi:3-methyl-2-oxobutanoate hydroxymethyltransferase
MLIAYDAHVARQADHGGVDITLVGDTAGDKPLGYEDTSPVTVGETLSNTAAVDHAVENAMAAGDMPFGSRGMSVETSVDDAVRLMKEAGADAVKLETAPHGDTTIEVIDRLTELGVPVQRYVGLTPQRMNQIGGGYVRSRDHSSSTAVETAERLEAAGTFVSPRDCDRGDRTGTAS